MKPIFEWEIPKDHPVFSQLEIRPERYRVFKRDDSPGGIMVESLYKGYNWTSVNSDLNCLIEHLLSLINKPKKKGNRAGIVLREDDFKAFYKSYPNKKAPGQAEKTWNALERKKKLPTIEIILTALKNQTKEKEDLKSLKRFCPEWPNPSTWLNGRSWENEIEKIAPADKKWSDPPDDDEIDDIPY